MSDADARGTIHGVHHQETGLGGSKCINTRFLQWWAPLGWKVLTPTGFLPVFGIGLLVGVGIVLHHNLRNPFTVEQHAPTSRQYRIKLAKEVSFLNKGRILHQLAVIPADSRIVIDATRSKVVDFDVKDILRDFGATALGRGISVEFLGISFEPATP